MLCISYSRCVQCMLVITHPLNDVCNAKQWFKWAWFTLAEAPCQCYAYALMSKANQVPVPHLKGSNYTEHFSTRLLGEDKLEEWLTQRKRDSSHLSHVFVQNDQNERGADDYGWDMMINYLKLPPFGKKTFQRLSLFISVREEGTV